MSPHDAAPLPIVLLPVGVDDQALDACLGALEDGTPAGTQVWLADNAQAGPRGLALIERWLARSISSRCATSPSGYGRRV